MSREAMDIDQSQSQKVQSSVQALCAGALASSVSNLSKYSHGIPSEKDYHFFYNFDEFRAPVQEIQKRSQSLLELVGTSANIWGKEMSLPEDLDDAYDWLVNVNDELLERLDGALDEFQTIRKKEEETGRANNLEEDGFQIVHGKKKKASKSHSLSEKGDENDSSRGSSVKMAKKDAKMSAKSKVPFHIPTIPRPQEEFNIMSNNSNQPFEHVWLQRSEDGLRFVHPLEQLSISDFVDKDVGVLQPVRPPPIECTPFKLVEKLKDLKELVAKLRDVNEFAVDLEHNQYRSFQGLTCLMQISTRSEDFVIDTLKLKVQIGPYLREIFKDPTKQKVMHGADRDIVWLQRDFGIYVCNLFDTGQASRVLKLERNSLEHLLHHFCEVSAKKEYQNADWRLRPLPEDMLRYAREDTHYLLYIYDLMRIKLFSMPKDSKNSDSPLAEVYKRSYDICTHLYEKELLTENSFLHIYGLQAAGLNSKQLAIVAGLYEWRDMVARDEDESTGYILPNKSLIEIAKQMPVSVNKLRWLIKSKHPYVERNLASVVSIIRHSILNASAYEDVVKHLNEARIETGLQASEDAIACNDGSESNIPVEKEAEGDTSQNSIGDGDKEKRCDNYVELTQPRQTLSGLSKEAIASACTKHPVKVAEAHVPLLNKPNRGLGALLVNSAPKRKLDTNKVDKEERKLEQIRSSVNLPFYSFSGRVEPSKPVAESPTSGAALEIQPPEDSRIESLAPLVVPGGNPQVDEIINLDDSSEEEGSIERDGEAVNEQKDNGSEVEEDEPMSLADLSSSFQKCLQTPNPKTKEVGRVEKPGGFVLVKPFDYEAARETVFFGEDGENTSGELAGNIQKAGKKKDSSQTLDQKDGGTRELLAQGKRRQAFPASGNRSSTFR